MPRPVIDMDVCDGCGICAKVCPVDALEMKDGKPVVPTDIEEKCLGCRACLRRCPVTCVRIVADETKPGRRHSFFGR